METKNYSELTLNYFERFSNKDIANLEPMLDEGCTLRDWEINVNGKQKVIDVMIGIFNSVETIHVNPLNIYNDGNIIIGELLITLNGKDELLVIDIIEYTSEGKIKEIKAYKG